VAAVRPCSMVNIDEAGAVSACLSRCTKSMPSGYIVLGLVSLHLAEPPTSLQHRACAVWLVNPKIQLNQPLHKHTSTTHE
jgi:hypothetical protein